MSDVRFPAARQKQNTLHCTGCFVWVPGLESEGVGKLVALRFGSKEKYL